MTHPIQYSSPQILKTNKNTLAYIIGVALGDGNLSNPNGRAIRLRVTCDTKYQKLIEKICQSIKRLLPNNKVSIVKRKTTYCDISCYSNKWGEWLGWNVGAGSKYKQNVAIPGWIKSNKNFSKKCLLGLMETDGCIYHDRGYKMVTFVSIIPNLTKDVYEIICKLGFKPHLYKLTANNKARFNIRSSKDVEKFVKLIRLNKQ